MLGYSTGSPESEEHAADADWFLAESKKRETPAPQPDPVSDRLAELERGLSAIDRIIGGSIKDNGDEKFTLNIKGEKYEGPAVEFVGYALTSIQGIARATLSPAVKEPK